MTPSRIAGLTLLLLCWSPSADAKLELNWGGKIQTDVRFRVLAKRVGDYYNELEAPLGVSRNQNLLRGKLTASVDKFTGVAELDFIWIGYANELAGIADLARYDQVDPYYLRIQSLYIEATNLLFDGLDVRIGHQHVLWGKGDQFNPTNTINPNDLNDILLFGEQLANLMAKVDYTFKGWTLSGVLVPIFKPAILPPTAPLATALSDRMPMVDDSLRWRLNAEKQLTQYLKYPTVVSRAIPELPETSFSNMQFALRLAGTIAEHDVALSYYYGRTDVPQAFLNYTRQVPSPQCNPADRTSCIDGVLSTEAHLGYPRVQVLGLNMAGQLNVDKLWRRLKPIGYRLELGVFFPQESTIALLQDPMSFGGGSVLQPGGEYAYATTAGWAGGHRPITVRSTPFAKWTLGLDYTFNRYVYGNAQWVHGMFDEFGAGDWINEGWAVRQGGVTSSPFDTMTCAYTLRDGRKCAHEILHPRLGDYLVIGVDVKLLEDRLLLRLFGVLDLSGIYEEKWDANAGGDQNADGKPDGARVRQHHNAFTRKGYSVVIYPEIDYNFGNGLELGAGVLMQLGDDYTKFGDPAAGGSLVWTRAKYSY
jgi:hypothetical protein